MNTSRYRQTEVKDIHGTQLKEGDIIQFIHPKVISISHRQWGLPEQKPSPLIQNPQSRLQRPTGRQGKAIGMIGFNAEEDIFYVKGFQNYRLEDLQDVVKIGDKQHPPKGWNTPQRFNIF